MSASCRLTTQAAHVNPPQLLKPAISASDQILSTQLHRDILGQNLARRGSLVEQLSTLTLVCQGILDCNGKERPADGSRSPINHLHSLQPLALNILAPTQSYTYVPFFHHSIVSNLMLYPGLESEEQTPQLQP
ncbi:uncharacterized [Tachysurus ichikawai]